MVRQEAMDGFACPYKTEMKMHSNPKSLIFGQSALKGWLFEEVPTT